MSSTTSRSETGSTRRGVTGGCTKRPGGAVSNSVTGDGDNGPRVHGVVRVELRSSNGRLRLPRPGQEYGGLQPVPPGLGVLVDIGGARHVDEPTVAHLVSAFREAGSVEVIGDDACSVVQMRSALARQFRGRT